MAEYKKMYSGVAFSPPATLTQPVNEADTVIHVSDSGVFPEGPNYATIGTDENAETILYAQKAEGLLSGCTRGVEGIARAWQVEEVIARNFTAKDYHAMIDNILVGKEDTAAKPDTVNGQQVDDNGNITVTASDVPTAAGKTVQQELDGLHTDVWDAFNALADTPKSYTASRPCIIRPSFVGRTVQDGTPSPDSPAPIKGVLNPWVAAYTGEPVQVTADVAPMMVLTDGTADRIVLRDGVWGIERYYKSIILTEDTSNVYAQADRLDITPLPSPPKNNGDAVSTHSSAFGMWNVVGGGQGMCSFDLVFPTQDAWKSYAKSQREAGTPITIWYRLDTPTFDPIPAWKGYGKIDPITVTTTITKPNPDAPISPDNVATITRTPVVTTGYRGAVKQLMAELFDGDSFDGTNLIAGDAITRHNLDIPLTPGNWTIEAGDDNGLLESTSVEVLPDPATYGNRIYPYQHTKVGNVHQLKGTPGAVEISFAATAPYLDGDTWTINGAPVAATYADGQVLLPTAVIAGESVRAVLQREAVKHIDGRIMPGENLLWDWNFQNYINNSALEVGKWGLTGVAGCSAEVQDDGILLTSPAPYGAYLYQAIDSEVVKGLVGKTVCFSYLCDDNNGRFSLSIYFNDVWIDAVEVSAGLVWKSITVPEGTTKITLQLGANAAGTCKVKAAKFELGNHFTGWNEPKFDALRLLVDKPTPKKNLLDNADLRKPVNQRELTIYQGPGYTIDRWLLWSAETSIMLKNGYSELSPAGNAGESALVQFIGSQATYAGTYTFTVEAEGYVCLDYYDDVFRSRRIYAGESGKRSVIAFVYNIDGDVIKQGNRVTIINPSTTENIKIYRVKLEPGPRFTGWHEPKPGAELAECQRYQYVLPGGDYLYTSVALGTSYQSGGISFVVAIPTSMRTCPVTTMTGEWFVRGNGKTIEFNASQVKYASSYLSDNAASLAIIDIPGLGVEDIGHAFELGRASDSDANIIFNANL